MKKNINTYSENLDKDVYRDLLYIFKKYNISKTIISNQFSSVHNYIKVYNTKKEIRDVWTSNGIINNFGLQKRYIRNAIEDASGNLKIRWTNTIKNVKNLVKNNTTLTNDEKHYIYYILKVKELLNNILNDIKFKIEKFNNLNFKKLNNLIKRYVRKTLSEKSKYKPNSSIMIDDQMYEVRDGYFYLTGLNKGRRYKIKLNCDIKLKGNLRLKLTDNNQLKISNNIDIDIKINDFNNIIGIDKNYINVFETSTNNSYGEKLNTLLNNYTDKLNEKNKKRQYYFNYIKTLKDQNKINDIKKFNLGSKKYNKTKNRLKEEIRKHINVAIKSLIINEQPKEISVENLNFTSTNKNISKKSNNKLNGWVKGLIQERLEYIGELNNVKISKVNSAFTSQICYVCGHFGERKNDIFYCQNCGKVEKSGTVAAKNVLNRLHDEEISLYTPYKYVHSILKKRLMDKMEIKNQSLTVLPKTCTEMSGAKYQKNNLK